MIFKRRRFGLIAATLLLPGCGDESLPDSTPVPAPAPVESETSQRPASDTDMPDSGDHAAIDSIYTVADYDPERDAAQDLSATIERTESEGKRILLEIGGQW